MHQLKLDSEDVLSPTYAGRSFSHDIPKYRLPTEGMSADGAYQLVHDELNLDGNPAQPRLLRHHLDGAPRRSSSPTEAARPRT